MFDDVDVTLDTRRVEGKEIFNEQDLVNQPLDLVGGVIFRDDVSSAHTV